MRSTLLLVSLGGALLGSTSTVAFQLPAVLSLQRQKVSTLHRPQIFTQPLIRQQPSVSISSSSLKSSSSSNSENNEEKIPRSVRWLFAIVKFFSSITRAGVELFEKSPLRFIGYSVLAFLALWPISPTFPARGEIPYSHFLDLIEEAAKPASKVVIKNVRISRDRIFFKAIKEIPAVMGMSFFRRKISEPQIREVQAFTRRVSAPTDLISTLRDHNIDFSAGPWESASRMSMRELHLGTSLMMLLALSMSRFMRRRPGGGTPGKVYSPDDQRKATFDDIEGAEEAKQEVMEFVEALRNPEKYSRLGARAPKGVLLVGPPGTGKTLLARATASVAGVPLLYCSGSAFIELYVGQGALRVRELFERAKQQAPCIIFIDEIDTLGKSRSFRVSGLGERGNDEAEQTLNQLLASMDGLDSSKQVCVMAATNRQDVLDEALVRPGRFDRIVKLRLPTVEGREKILRVHASKNPAIVEGRGIDQSRPNALGVENRIDLSAVAKATEGCSGAELEFIVNEAAIRAVRREAVVNSTMPRVLPIDFEESLKHFHDTRPKYKSMGAVMWDTLMAR
eukprot:Nitzschia sp. Nitz4//scaffold22_size323478//306978//308672//NITZ4_000593-RA/size323478-processed-gene-0.490-mRNA-1//-1//CDS//3329543195//2001//frame0